MKEKKNIVINFKEAAGKLLKLYQQRRDLNAEIETYEAELKHLGKFIEKADQLESSLKETQIST